jgi:uncharacterized membrane protein YesL
MNDRLRDTFLDAYLSAIPLITLNVLWFICSLPIVTLIPSTAALFYATYRIAHGKSADRQTFFEGFRRYFWSSWLWGLLNGVVVAGLVANELFYTRTDSEGLVGLRGVFIALGIFWLGIQVYTFPLMLEQEQPNLRLAIRNSLVIFLKRPVHTVGWAVLIGGLTVASTLMIWPVWMFFTASVCAWLANRATLTAIGQITGQAKTEANRQDAENAKSNTE